MTLRFNDRIYILEFKVVEPAGNGSALAQLEERGYAGMYRALNQPIHLIGVEFSRETRTLAAFDAAPGCDPRSPSFRHAAAVLGRCGTSRIADILRIGSVLHRPNVLEDPCHIVTEACGMFIPKGPDFGDYRVMSCYLHGRPPSARWVCRSPAAHSPPAGMLARCGFALQHWRCTGSSKLPDMSRRS